MTQPRQFLPGTTYFVTRRCTQRRFLLKPTALTTQIFLYCIGVAAEKTGVQIHAACALSNHWHVIATDPETKIAEFYAWVHKYVSKAVNASIGRWENLWASEKASVVTLEKPGDVIDKTIYTLANPVEAGLVPKGSKWPGVWFFRESDSQTIKRPKVYFSDDGEMPETVDLQIQRPPQYSYMNQEEYEQHIATLLGEKEEQIADDLQSQGRTFMGVRKVMLQRRSASPKTLEPRRNLNPKIASKSKWHRLEAIERNREFQREYRAAFNRWRKGDHSVTFPAGTYALRKYAAVQCAPG